MEKVISTLIAGVMVVCIIGVVPSFAKTLQEKLTVKPDKTISPADESLISATATKVLRHIAGARGAIHDKDIGQAKKELGQAMVLVQIIKASLPTTKVKDHIWVANKHLNYEDTEEVKPDLIPIYTDLTELENFVPVRQARKNLDMAKKALEKGDKEAAKNSLKAVDNTLIYTEMDLPLASTEKQIIAAQEMLAQKKPKEADKELQIAEDSVQFISVLSEAPITLAKKSLWQATRDYAAGKYAAAKQDLDRAGSYLKQMSQNADKKTREEAKKIGNDTDVLKGKVKKGDSATGAAITNLWERGKALSEREAELASIGWQKFRVQNKEKEDLIDAKLHLSYAKTYQYTTAETDKAKTEINKAKEYLKSADEKADSRTRSKISDMEKEVDQIKADLSGKKEAARARYNKVISDLRQLIRDL